MERSILMRNSFAVCSHWQIWVNYTVLSLPDQPVYEWNYFNKEMTTFD